MKQERRWCKGNFTVEASIIIPFLCFLLAFTVQMSFYLHDVCVIVAASYEAAQKAAEPENGSRAERGDCAKQTVESLLDTKRLAIVECVVESNVIKNKVQVIVKAKTFFFRGMNVEVKKEVLYSNPVEYLRAQKNLKRGFEKEDQ